MKANELRIGNIVNQDSEKFKTGKVLSINSKSILLENQYRTQRALIKKIQPIPLTEEWLDKFRWDKKSSFYDKGLFSITALQPNNTLYFNSWKIIEHIEYVHQLQNLYFELTGEELTLK